MPLLDVENLRVRFETHHGTVRAVDGVNLSLSEGETLGLVGESGSGKSVTNLALMGLIPSPPGVLEANHIRLGDLDLNGLSDRKMRKIRGKEISMIFQDPMTSLNPLLTVGQQLREMLTIHTRFGRKEVRKRCMDGLDNVGIPNAEARMDQYPHELSGGMRQRVMIAMGLLCEPKVLLADEPTTALDVTIQAQILELMKDLQERTGTAIILVTHDLGVVAGMADRVNVMYAGRIVESAPTYPLYASPMHPYTRGLLASVPTLEGSPEEELQSIPGQPPDLADLPAGCAFEPRCSFANDRCRSEVPLIETIAGEADRRSACFETAKLTSLMPVAQQAPIDPSTPRTLPPAAISASLGAAVSALADAKERESDWDQSAEASTIAAPDADIDESHASDEDTALPPPGTVVGDSPDGSGDTIQLSPDEASDWFSSDKDKLEGDTNS
ncbi:MAG: oligopeptide transport system ATP-binding protein [Planctomycetota bacterium]|jgi:oligopeptide transport system ATP-binding protein